MSCVVGIGVDMVESARMKAALERWGTAFLDRVFLPNEREYCESRPEPWRHYAGRFAIKEAVSKAFGTGIGRHLGWQDIEVVRDAVTGAPSVRLTEKAERWARSRGVARILVSLSHTRTHTVAQAVLLGAEENA